MKKSILLLISFIILFSFHSNAQYTKLQDFTGTANGSYPYSSLVTDGTFLYGVAYNGGTNNAGIVFRIKQDGTGDTVLYNFNASPSGTNPYGALFFDGDYLYGMTYSGGANNFGLIYKLKTDGTGYTTLLDFDGTNNGKNPYGALISDGTFLYGMTTYGGVNDNGVIFKIMPDGSGYLKLLDFDGVNKGSNPTGTLFSDGTFLYGVTNYGGTDNMGTLFKIKPDASGFVKLTDFTGTANGAFPKATLTYDGTFLYVMTQQGGTGNLGTIFKIKTDGSSDTTLLDFATTNGKYPQGALIFDGIYFYGMTTSGGTSNFGTIFKIKPDGTAYLNLFDFDGPVAGRSPYGSLISIGSDLYGTTSAGGTNNMGTLFKYQYCATVTYTQSPVICSGESFAVGTNTYTTNNTYVDTITTAQGCDSIVTTNLTVLPANTFTQSPVVCSGESFTVGTSIYSVSDTYVDTLTSVVSGCDSIITTNLTVLSANTFTQSPVVCAGQSLTVGSNTYTITNTYVDTLTSLVNGCDSVVTTNLTVLPANTFSQSFTICTGDSVVAAGNTYTLSNTYVDTLSSLVSGCDSIVTTNLTVTPPLNIGVSYSMLTCGCSDSLLLADNGFAAYQWIDCNNSNLPLAGEINQYLSPAASGDYAVIITENNCSDTSSCYNVIINSITENFTSDRVTVFPNPGSGVFQIKTDLITSGSQCEIYNALGEQVYRSEIKTRNFEIDFRNEAKGVYFLHLKSEQGKVIKKIIIQE